MSDLASETQRINELQNVTLWEMLPESDRTYDVPFLLDDKDYSELQICLAAADMDTIQAKELYTRWKYSEVFEIYMVKSAMRFEEPKREIK